MATTFYFRARATHWLGVLALTSAAAPAHAPRPWTRIRSRDEQAAREILRLALVDEAHR